MTMRGLEKDPFTIKGQPPSENLRTVHANDHKRVQDSVASRILESVGNSALRRIGLPPRPQTVRTLEHFQGHLVEKRREKKLREYLKFYLGQEHHCPQTWQISSNE